MGNEKCKGPILFGAWAANLTVFGTLALGIRAVYLLLTLMRNCEASPLSQSGQLKLYVFPTVAFALCTPPPDDKWYGLKCL